MSSLFNNYLRLLTYWWIAANQTMASIPTKMGFEDSKSPYEDLCDAIKSGESDKVKNLLGKGVRVDMIGDEEDSPLHLAIKHGAGYDILEMLLDRGADVAGEGESGELPLMLAIEKGNVDAFKLILDRGAEIYVMDGAGSTPLHRAAELGLDEIVEILLKKGLFVDLEDRQRYTPLHRAASQGHESIVKSLLAYGANLHEEDLYGRTALHHSTMGGHYGIVCRLLDYEANVNLKDFKGRSCLHDAAWLGHADVVQILLNCKADVNSVDRDGCVALHHAAIKGHVDVIFMLMERGADLSIQDRSGRTPLHHVILRGDYDMIKFLIENSDDLNTPDFNNCSPLRSVLSGMVSTTAFRLNENPELTELIVKHVVRCKMMESNSTVDAEEFEGFKQYLSDEGWSDLCSYCNKCVDEIKKIRQFQKIDDSISLYDFLTKNSTTLVKYVKNEDAEVVLDSAKWEKEFPVYSTFIKARSRRAVEKMDLLMSGARCLSLIVHYHLPHVKGLPDIPCRIILRDMNDLDLGNLTRACHSPGKFS